MPRPYLTLAAATLALAGCGQGAAPEPAASESGAATVSAVSSGKAVPAAAPGAAESTVLTCTYPVNGNSDTAESVLSRFGKDARRATISGPEGSEFAGIVLWGDDPARRLELIIDEESRQERIFGIRLRSPGSVWKVAGLGLGDPLAKVVDANGGPFTLWGFGWDYGGYVSDLKGGKLERLPGGCDLSLRFAIAGPGNAPDSLSGDSEKRSDDPAFAKAPAVLDELALDWR